MEQRLDELEKRTAEANERAAISVLMDVAP
jgi:hypothetical protein